MDRSPEKLQDPNHIHVSYTERKEQLGRGTLHHRDGLFALM
jgi:hypothetical protein